MCDCAGGLAVAARCRRRGHVICGGFWGVWPPAASTPRAARVVMLCVHAGAVQQNLCFFECRPARVCGGAMLGFAAVLRTGERNVPMCASACTFIFAVQQGFTTDSARVRSLFFRDALEILSLTWRRVKNGPLTFLRYIVYIYIYSALGLIQRLLLLLLSTCLFSMK